MRLLQELEDRASRGEFVPAFALLSIYAGQGDLAGMRRMLARAITEDTPPFSLRVTSAPLLEAYISDPEIERLLSHLYG